MANQPDRAKIVDFYLAKIDEKDFDILQVRKDLEKNNIEEEEIKIIVRLVDNEMQRRLIHGENNTDNNHVIWMGGILTAIGLFITLGTYIGFIDMGNSFVFAYGPLFTGAAILLGGLAYKRRQ
ncbi:MAG: hypothetical protein O9302_14640 [Cyclobacteriaceae bacterium]|jgi:hypothetical protein|nr:hypothetical protein [Cytophagales bacterium]MCZ8329301.1 hypothetical protein [Cyclobacteriaceae bacterium]